MALNNWQKRFNRLEQIIKDRQEFEAINPQFFEDIDAYRAKHPEYKTSSYKTDFNYRDENNETLLRYAVRIGELERIKDLVENKHIAVSAGELRGALIFGNLDIAKYLYEKIEDCSSISLSDIEDQACREWFSGLITTSLKKQANQNYLSFFSTSQKMMFSNQMFYEDVKTRLDRIAEIGDKDQLQIIRNDVSENFRYQHSLNSMMRCAAANNQIEIMKILLIDGALLNPNEKYLKAPILSAVDTKQIDTVKFLIESGADINYQGELKRTALMLAILKKDDAMVEFLLKNKADLSLKDEYGKTALHYAAQQNNPELTSRLLMDENAKFILETQDIFGMKPLDYAIENNHSDTIAILDPKYNLATLSTDIRRKTYTPVNQGAVMNKMKYFLTSHYRDLDFFSTGGHCNGFAFLRDMYAYSGLEDYYFDTLALMSAWDGSQTALDAPFDKNILQSKYYKNLGELFEQWINDIVWFQHSMLVSLFQPNPELQQQDNRNFQFQVIGHDEKLEPKMISYVPGGMSDLGCFLENINIFSQRMPIGARLELSGSEHATSVYIDENHDFNYYDPNFTRKARPFSHSKEFCEVVVDTKIIGLGKSADTFHSEMRFFYYSNPDIQNKIKNNDVLKPEEIPTTKEAFEEFQHKSMNRYSPLHIAVLTGSTYTVKKLLSDKKIYCDINAMNKNGNTALTMAIAANNTEMIQTLLDFYPSSRLLNPAEFIEAYNKGKQEIVEILLKNHDKIDLVPFFYAAVNKRDFKTLDQLLSRKIVDVNAPYNGNIAIGLAIGRNDLEIAKLFLKHGASLTQTNPNDKSGWSSPLKNIVTSSSEMIDLILDALIDINQVDQLGNGIIHYIQYAKEDLDDYLLKALVKRGADLNMQSQQGNSVLELIFSLFKDEKLRFVRLLLPYTIINFDDPLHRKEIHELLISSINAQDVPVLNLLLNKCPPDILNTHTADGVPPLFYALRSENETIVKALLNAGADPNITYLGNGNTCLHFVVKTQKTPFVSLLLDHHADVSHKNKEGKSVLDFVDTFSNEDIKKIFHERDYIKSAENTISNKKMTNG